MIISPAPVPNQFRMSDGSVLKLKVFEMGAWDLTSDIYIDIDIGDIDNDDVVLVSGSLIFDGQSAMYWGVWFTTLVGYGEIYYGVSDLHPNTIRVYQTSLCTNVNLSDDEINRGYVYVWYKI